MEPAAEPRRPKPAMLVVEDEDDVRELIRAELERRYGADYLVACERTAEDARERLDEIAASGAELAIVLADQSLPGMDGGEFLALVGGRHRETRRGLLVRWGAWADETTAPAMLRAMALGQMHYYVLKPWRPRDEYFHRTITEFLQEWERAASAADQEVTVVGRPRSPRSARLRDQLTRSGIPHAFHATDSPAGRRVLVETGQEDAEVPIVRLLDGEVLVNPSNTEIASAWGVMTQLDGPADFDVAVVGAGPAGLAAAVYSSSEGLRTLAIERDSIGGQAGSSALIRNYLGFSRGISGADLAQRAYQQAWVLGARFLHTRDVVGLRREDDRFVLTSVGCAEARARAVVLATGVEYRRLDLPALEELHGAGVFYGASVAEARGLTGEQVYVVGGGNSAGQAAMHLARYAKRVTLLVRGASIVDSMSSYLREQVEAARNVEVRLGAEVVGGGGGDYLSQVEVRDRTSGATVTEEAAGLFVMIGARPRTEWLPPELRRDQWGYVLTGADVAHWPLQRPPLASETSVPGVFAVGDVRNGSVKRVASAVGEGSVVIRQVWELLEGEVADAERERTAARR